MTHDLFASLGDRRYRIDRRWGQFPQRGGLRSLTKLAVDAADNVYAFQRSDPPILVLDKEGNFVRSIGEGLIADAHGIFVTPAGIVFAVDRGGHQLIAFDLEGHVLFAWGKRGHPRYGAPFNHPSDVAVAENGDVYVSDGYGNSTVHRFSADGELKQSWGRLGRGPGEFMTPHGIWVLDDGRVAVGDRENDRVQVFTSEGEFITAWTNFFRPMDIYADRQGLIYVSDQVPSLTALRGDGHIVGRCQPVPNIGHAVRGDSSGNLYLAEPRIDEIIRLSPVE
jgi:sugar lactone lactonase YvrE